MCRFEISDEEKGFVVDQYKNGVSIIKLSKIVHRTGSTISKILQDAGIETCKRYEKDESFFGQINSFDKAYCLGRLYADGHVIFNISDRENFKSAKYEISLTACEKDKNDLVAFLKCIKANYPIVPRWVPPSSKGGKNWSLENTVFVNSKKMVEDLMKLGCFAGKKGDKIRFPTTDIVPEEFLPGFCLGYFDGDGSTYDGSERNVTPFVILGNQEFCAGMMEWLSNKLNLPKATVYPHGTIWAFGYGGRLQVRKIRDLLYKNATIWMPRKRKIFDDFLDAPRRKYQHLFDFEEQKVIDEYKSGKKCDDICKDNNINNTRLFGIVERNNIDLRNPEMARKSSERLKNRLSKEKQHEIVDDYLSGTETEMIIKKYGVSLGMFRRMIRKFGKEMRGPRQYFCNENYFSTIDSKEKAYWLGRMEHWRLRIDEDQHIHEIGLSSPLEDKDYLQQFLNAISATYLIKETNDDRGNVGCRVSMSSKKMIEDIKRNSRINVPREFLVDYYRGVFDGCGSWIPVSDFIFDIGLPTLEMAESLQSLLLKESIVKNKTKITNEGDGGSFRIRYSGSYQVTKIFDWLYKDATIYLKRKYDKFLPFKKYQQEDISKEKLGDLAKDFTSGMLIKDMCAKHNMTYVAIRHFLKKYDLYVPRIKFRQPVALS
jgi:hypothetical protein